MIKLGKKICKHLYSRLSLMFISDDKVSSPVKKSTKTVAKKKHRGGKPMSKPKTEKVVAVRNNESGKEVSCRSTQLPRENEVGVYVNRKLNIIGLAILQAKGMNVVDNKSWEELLKTTFELPENAFGSIGTWKTEEDKAKWGVTIDGSPYMSDDMPTIPLETVPAPPVTIQQPQKVATDTTQMTENQKDEINIQRGVQALQAGIDVSQVQDALIKKVGKTKAKSLMDNIKAYYKAVTEKIISLEEMGRAEEVKIISPQPIQQPQPTTPLKVGDVDINAIDFGF